MLTQLCTHLSLDKTASCSFAVWLLLCLLPLWPELSSPCIAIYLTHTLLTMFSSPSIHVVHIQVPRLDEVTLIHKYPDMDDTTKNLQDISHLGLLIYMGSKNCHNQQVPRHNPDYPGFLVWFGCLSGHRDTS